MTYLFLALALCGTASVLAGLWLVWPPLAMVLGGLWLILVAIKGDRRWAS